MKKNHMPFFILFAVYTIAGVIALITFGVNGSYLSHSQTVPVTSVAKTDRSVDPVTSNVPVTEPAPPDNTPDPAETDETPETTKDSTNLTAETEKTETDSIIPEVPTSAEDPATPVETESPKQKTTKPEKTYYAFTVIDDVTGVCIRATDDRDSEIVSYIDGGNSGYILEQGDTRSKILTKKGTVGYIYNEYITVSEIPKKEFPKEYR